MGRNPLLDAVLAGLQDRKGEWPSIAKETGLDYSWLTKLAQGQINDPGIKKIERLAGYLQLDGYVGETPAPETATA